MSTTILPARLSPRCGDDCLHGGIGDGQHDDVAGDRSGAVGPAQQLDGVSAPAGEAAMAWPMLPVPMMERFAMMRAP